VAREYACKYSYVRVQTFASNDHARTRTLLQCSFSCQCSLLASECDDPRILHAVLLAAAATASALAQTGAQDTVQARRRGGTLAAPADSEGEPPGAVPEPGPTDTGGQRQRPTAVAHWQPSRLASISSNRHSPPRAGQARPQPGAPPTSSSNRRAATSATLATRKIPPLSPIVMRWSIVDRA
jgi:hypothetical protein